MTILSWDKPKQVLTKEEWQNISADSAPPGVYTPNMSGEDVRRWKAKLIKGEHPRVEIRKDSTVIVVSLGGGYSYNGYKPEHTRKVNLHIATAGVIQWNWQKLDEFNQAIAEARAVLEAL